MEPRPPTLRRCALAALAETDPDKKVQALRSIAPSLDPGGPEHLHASAWLPGRPQLPRLVSPGRLRSRSAATRDGRAALLHSLVHIELNAVDLALDAVWRFPDMPDAYYRDWMQVAKEEALHFELLSRHLATLGFSYGDFDAHNGLWEMAMKTQGDLLARLALVPRTLEARGLDASPAVKAKLLAAGDLEGAAILDLILRDEIGHVAVGNRWFRWCCERRSLEPRRAFRMLARQYGAPALRGPFNLDARRAAGFTEDELADLAIGEARPVAEQEGRNGRSPE